MRATDFRNRAWVSVGGIGGDEDSRAWEIVREKAGLKDVRIHDLRHSFASRALARGHSLTMIGRLLGHSHSRTTARTPVLHGTR